MNERMRRCGAGPGPGRTRATGRARVRPADFAPKKRAVPRGAGAAEKKQP